MKTLTLFILSSLFISFIYCSTQDDFDPPYYSQLDPQWESITLGFGPATIGTAGCLLTSVSSMIAGEGILVNGATSDPPVMNTWLKNNNGFTDGYGFVWESIQPLGFTLEGFVNDTASTIAALNQGKRVFLHVLNGGHYVLALYDNGWGFETMDPIFPGRIYSYGEVVQTTIYAVKS